MNSYAQEKADPVRKVDKADTVKLSFIPKGLRLGFDLMGATRTVIDNGIKELEFSADVEIHRYLINLEYGKFDATRKGNDNSIYTNNGSYLRGGIDINMLKKDTETNVLFLGVRYAKSTFDDQLQYGQTNALFGDVIIDRSNTNISARWLELTAGIKLHITSNIWLGFTNRFKFAKKLDESTSLTPHDIPGYGKAGKDNYWGFNYQIMYRIPLRDKK